MVAPNSDAPQLEIMIALAWNASKAANIPFVLIENGYTEKKSNEIYHDHLVKDFVGLEKIIIKYLNDWT